MSNILETLWLALNAYKYCDQIQKMQDRLDYEWTGTPTAPNHELNNKELK